MEKMNVDRLSLNSRIKPSSAVSGLTSRVYFYMRPMRTNAERPTRTEGEREEEAHGDDDADRERARPKQKYLKERLFDRSWIPDVHVETKEVQMPSGD